MPLYYDALGSAANVTASNGATQWIRSYEPFGSIRTEQDFRSANAKPTFMKFTGEYQDPTGLYHLRARQYDPWVGRFLTRDPVGQSPNHMAISAYAYVANRPAVLVDPSGETFRPSSFGRTFALFASSHQAHAFFRPQCVPVGVPILVVVIVAAAGTAGAVAIITSNRDEDYPDIKNYDVPARAYYILNYALDHDQRPRTATRATEAGRTETTSFHQVITENTTFTKAVSRGRHEAQKELLSSS